jgi:glucokinase
LNLSVNASSRKTPGQRDFRGARAASAFTFLWFSAESHAILEAQLAASPTVTKANETSKSAKPILGIDLGGTKILGGVVTADGKILARAKKKTRVDRGPQQILDRIAEVAREAAEAANLKLSDLRGLGIGAPGQIDFRTGRIIYAPNLGWRDVPLRDHLSDALGLPVTLDNDVNAVAVAEVTWGVGKGAQDLVAISVGTGIGAGLILGGKLRHGFNGTAGEIGHCVIDQDGPKWPLSNRGCLEAMASRTAMGKRLTKAMDKGVKTALRKIIDGNTSKIGSGAIAVAAKKGDKLVLAELREAARLVGLAIGNVINLLNPEMFVLGGGLIEACGEFMMPQIEKVARATAIANAADGVRIVQSKLGDDAGILGAAALVRG